jgi:hypothetical protein
MFYDICISGEKRQKPFAAIKLQKIHQTHIIQIPVEFTIFTDYSKTSNDEVPYSRNSSAR